MPGFTDICCNGTRGVEAIGVYSGSVGQVYMPKPTPTSSIRISLSISSISSISSSSSSSSVSFTTPSISPSNVIVSSSPTVNCSSTLQQKSVCHETKVGVGVCIPLGAALIALSMLLVLQLKQKEVMAREKLMAVQGEVPFYVQPKAELEGTDPIR